VGREGLSGVKDRLNGGIGDDVSDNEHTPQQRAAKISWWLCEGRTLTVRDAARLIGVSPEGARKMLNNISSGIPITEIDGVWMSRKKADAMICADVIGFT
jgi:hypothetical protein